MARKRRENATKFHKTREVTKKGGNVTRPFFAAFPKEPSLYLSGFQKATDLAGTAPHESGGETAKRGKNRVFDTRVL